MLLGPQRGGVRKRWSAWLWVDCLISLLLANVVGPLGDPTRTAQRQCRRMPRRREHDCDLKSGEVAEEDDELDRWMLCGRLVAR